MLEFLAHIIQPLYAGLLLSTLIDAASGGNVLRRPLRSWAVHLALLSLAFCAELLVFRRPWFACSQMLVLQGVVLVVSAVKMSTMREPFVFQDVDYFIDMIKHPRLYLPFFGIGKLCLILVGVAAMIDISMKLEPDLLFRVGIDSFLGGWMPLAAGAAAMLWLATRRPFATSFDPQADLQSWGMSTNLAAYAVAENQPLPLPDRFAPLAVRAQGAERPNIVAVQSESFFDARRMWPEVADDVYGWLDAARAEALQHGLLEVPAIGANTVRTEFAFLSGLREETLGVHRFNPYRRLPWRGVRTIAHNLRDAGYRTVCVHPYAAGFYHRDQVYPRFGFDEFIDVRAFGPEAHAGPFVGDVAVAAKVHELLGTKPETPLFVFIITMENHGPLHLEHVTPAEAKDLYRGEPPQGIDDLGVYLRHVRNAGRMLSTLRTGLSAQSRPGMLCWYGDHVPIMPGVYARTGFTDARTDYFLWQTEPVAAPPRVANLAAADLATALLQAVSLRHAPVSSGSSPVPVP